MNHLDLCSGIGGFALAARWMGWTTVGFAEIDPFASRVLAKHWPGVPNHGDIRSIPDGIRADILTAGIPCQPYSCAGKQLDAEDDRALWPVAFDVVRRIKPSYVVLENVAGFIGMALDGVLADLEAEGYETGAVVLPACAVNAPHRRDRVWIVAHADRAGRREQRRAFPVQEKQPSVERHRACDFCGFKFDCPNCCGEGIGGGEDVPDPASDGMEEPERENGQPDARGQRPSGLDAIGSRVTAHADREPLGRLAESRRQRGGGQFELGVGGNRDGLSARMDRPDGSGPDYWDGDWERGIPRVARGMKDRASRLKALGNAIVPQVAYQIFRAIGAAST